ncbi:uncharacterized protein LOC132704478 [Cylas formicarius]|uniref:uncharacterized protein LOC132704478 n=1 Tax=Cylas formicarius TaxID=197179 RepID=UPI002958C1E8|nr:uncharacterized protein LOC132704478 [Cylas formicarius]
MGLFCWCPQEQRKIDIKNVVQNHLWWPFQKLENNSLSGFFYDRQFPVPISIAFLVAITGIEIFSSKYGIEKCLFLFKFCDTVVFGIGTGNCLRRVFHLLNQLLSAKGWQPEHEHSCSPHRLNTKKKNKRKTLRRMFNDGSAENADGHVLANKAFFFSLIFALPQGNQQVRQTLEERKSLKVLQREFKNRTHITKLVNENNIECTRMEELKELTEAFYRSLYESKAKPPLETSSKERQKVMNVGSEEIPDITSEEIERTMSKMPKGRTAGGDGIVLEMLIYGGEIVLDILKILYNKCLLECDVPADWKNALVVLLFKKGDKTKLSNYRPISLLSVMYKVFIKIITERLTNKLDSYQPKEQAGFRRGFSTLDHLQVVRTVIEKTNEYNIPIWVAFIDYEKAFDSVEIWAVLKALSNSRVDYRCTTLIQNIYSNATLQVMLKDFTDKIDIGRGVRQGESISPKLFTLALEDMFKNIGWETKGIKINGEYLSHLRFADDIVLFADNQQDLQDMLLELDQNSKKIGLKMNIGKTKYMTNDNITQETRIEIDNKKIEHTESYVYLGQKIEVSKNNLKAELPRRISLAWTAFGRLREVFCSGLPNTLKAQIFDQYVLPTLTYGTETWAINKEIICKLQTTQRAMERRMIGVTLRDRINNNIIRERSKVTDVIERLCRLRWSWAGHIARSKDDRWTRRVMEWRPWSSKRSRGRPQTRWTDDIKRLVGDNWMWHAQDRKEWQCLGEAYVRRWMDS